MSDVQDRLDRLRQAGRLKRRRGRRDAEETTHPQSIPPPSISAPSGLSDLAELPGMEIIDGPAGRFLLRTQRFALSHRQGEVPLGALLDLPAGSAEKTAGEAALAAFDFREVLFIDTETSGLAGGAGTIVFLTGVGAFEGEEYVVRQYFARTPAEEPAYLYHLHELLNESQGLVSFNGKAFDLPLLRSRFILNGIEPPHPQPHLDLLHPARRLWRERLGACNFGNLEKKILAHRRSGQDVPSWMIPNLWFRFAGGGNNVDDMVSILYHNQEDIVSMVPLAHVLCGTFAGQLDPHPDDLLSLARSFTRQGRLDEAEDAYRRALDGPLTRSQHIEVMTGLAAIFKRQGRRAKAVIWWEALTAMAPPNSVDPYVELAKYHEWESRDLETARRWTEAALEHAQTWRPGYHRTQVMAELEHRLDRLNRKLER